MPMPCIARCAFDCSHNMGQFLMARFVEPGERHAALTRTRNLKMARSTHAYVRGSTAKFYEWLANSPVAATLPQGPAVWICGDCHLGNLGPVADAHGRVAIQIRDLDQSVVGNPVHDIVRMAISLQTAVRSSDLPGVVSARMIEAMADAYEAAFLPDTEIASEVESEVVRTVRRRAMGRRWKHLAKERIKDVRPTIPLGKKYWPTSRTEREALEELLQSAAVRQLTLTSFRSSEDSKLNIHDAAYWRKGCSSLGLLRFAVLIGVKDEDGSETFGLIDVKEASRSVAPQANRGWNGATMPEDNAERVVAGALALSPYLGERMAAGRMLGKSVIVRELLPQDLKIEIEQFSRRESIASARYLARVVGEAHARQMDAGTRAKWHAQLAADHSKSLDAPVWLWRAVVDLVAKHEAAYLTHCHAYALAEAA